MLSNPDFRGKRGFLEEVMYKLKTDGEVGVGQMERDLCFGKIILATVHVVHWNKCRKFS